MIFIDKFNSKIFRKLNNKLFGGGERKERYLKYRNAKHPLNRNLRSTNKTTEGDQQTTESVGTTAGTSGITTTGTTGNTTTGTTRITTVEIHPESDTQGIIQHTTMQQQDQAQQNPQVQPFIFNATALLQPSIYDGSSKPSSWISQFSSWTKLQNLTDKNAINALTFYLSGPAKIWFQSLPDSAKTNLASIIKLLEVRFTTSDDEDILTTQATNESVHEFLDRLTLKATSQRIPECLVLKIARKGFKQALQQSIIQQNPKNMAELREAAVIAEKCLASNISQQISINAISQNDFKSLSDTIKLLSDKVENLNIENQELKANFGKANQNYQNKPNWQNNRAPGRNFNGQRNFPKIQVINKPDQLTIQMPGTHIIKPTHAQHVAICHVQAMGNLRCK
ncbi:unnamed protein product [Mytilus edulis]|uniref:Retrotransposon gag domain-containing protein n=1 Tax=Mytilus edulis TaxID=6550 RepID=A0A8S3RL59_MYTED|nr:unnamed protein product [Mytilus edulis]